MAYIAIYKCPKCTTLGKEWYDKHRGDKLDYPSKCDICGGKILYEGEAQVSKKFISKEMDMEIILKGNKVVGLEPTVETKSTGKIIIKGDKYVK